MRMFNETTIDGGAMEEAPVTISLGKTAPGERSRAETIALGSKCRKRRRGKRDATHRPALNQVWEDSKKGTLLSGVAKLQVIVAREFALNGEEGALKTFIEEKGKMYATGKRTSLLQLMESGKMQNREILDEELAMSSEQIEELKAGFPKFLTKAKKAINRKARDAANGVKVVQKRASALSEATASADDPEVESVPEATAPAT